MMRSSQLKAMGLPNYDAYLTSGRWERLKVAYEKRRFKACALCGKPADNLHHNTYARLGRERLDDLTWLCSYDHWRVTNCGCMDFRKTPTPKQKALMRSFGCEGIEADNLRSLSLDDIAIAS
jgi:hypothetical protein